MVMVSIIHERIAEMSSVLEELICFIYNFREVSFQQW